MCIDDVNARIHSLESEQIQILDYVDRTPNVDIISCLSRVVQIRRQLDDLKTKGTVSSMVTERKDLY